MWLISRAPFQTIADLPYFIGREHELAQLRHTLLDGGFVTICNVWGMGGVGKASLAAHLAYQLRGDFPDGVLSVEVLDHFLNPPTNLADRKAVYQFK